MYKISVPVNNGLLTCQGRDRIAEELKKIDAERVFLSLSCYETDEKKRQASIETLADNCRFLKENGFEVGAWIWTFMFEGGHPFKNMCGINGQQLTSFACPTDQKFVRFAADYIREIAETGVQIILFDDDFRYGFLGSEPACLCDEHLAQINRITGETHTRAEIASFITSGRKNKYRDAFLQANGDAFRDFSKVVRDTVDKVDPGIRIGICASMSAWDLDGADAMERSRILAGGTKPLIRLCGAPYWAVGTSWGNCLQDVVELERMESVWTKDGAIEIMAEGDPFPRPRSSCPASYLEGFDTAIRASGCTDGILKYGIDYCSNADYETGYRRFHEKNRSLYREIDRHFGGKTACGVRVYESMNKIADAVRGDVPGDTASVQDLFFSSAARTLAHNTIPTVYEGDGVTGIVFGENARRLPLDALKNGLILDAAAAKILADRGVDVGVSRFGEALPAGRYERFLDADNRILTRGISVYRLEISDRAQILSETETTEGVIPMSFRYENAEKNRFLVLNLDPYYQKTNIWKSNVLKHYARSRQYADQIEWLGGKKLPAYVYGHPALYIQCKEKNGALAVGLWNFFADTALDPIVELGQTYSEISFFHCSGRLEGNRVYLSDLPAFGFAGFEVAL